MSLRLRFGITAAVLVTVAVGVSCWVSRRQIACQLALYRVGSAATLSQAQTAMEWFEAEPGDQARLSELAAKWGSGNRRFDIHLAEHVSGPTSSEALRKAFSLELAWREDLLPRWSHYWCWRATGEPDERIASISSHFDLIMSTESVQAITWREVLDLQAVFHVTGHPRLAKRLSPDNWRSRYAKWQDARPSRLPKVPRPQEPMPD